MNHAGDVRYIGVWMIRAVVFRIPDAFWWVRYIDTGI